jgi:hypothetical protein
MPYVEHPKRAVSAVRQRDVHCVPRPRSAQGLANGRGHGYLVARRVLPAPSDHLVLVCATSVVRHPHGRSEPGAAIPGSALHDRCELHELLELCESGVVDGRLLKCREQVVVFGRTAERARLAQSSGELRALLVSQ